LLIENIASTAAIIFLCLTPVFWDKLVETLEKVGWVSGIIAAIFTLLPISIQDLPTGWKFAPIIISAIILSLTAYVSHRNKSKETKRKLKEQADKEKELQEFKDTDEAKRKRERDWRYFPAGSTYYLFLK